MKYQLQNLTEEERQLVLDAPILVAILIGGSDNDYDEEEITRTIELINTKTFSETADLRELYKELDKAAEERLMTLCDNLPEDVLVREKQLSERLAKLNDVFPKMERKYSLHFYNSLKDFAVHVANASGSAFGTDNIGDREKNLLGLDMLNKPEVI